MRVLLVSLLIGAGSAGATVLDERVLVASVIAHSAIIEAQSADSVFFEHCEYFPTSGEVHGAEIPADHLFNCNPVGPVLPNLPAVRTFLEERFTDAMTQALVKLDETGYALPIARDTALGAAASGTAVAVLEHLVGRTAGLMRAGTIGGFALIGGGMTLGYRLWDARQSRYEQKRSKQIQKVIDLAIPPEPQLIDEKATSRGEAGKVVRLFAGALRVATEQTRANLGTLVSDSNPTTTPNP